MDDEMEGINEPTKGLYIDLGRQSSVLQNRNAARCAAGAEHHES